ncbi:hypothetical protein KA082_00775 [Candidatus Woesebacteria bacterium]|nr:hypothetical protein [Candidatus Woesebacteria bacterium]
MKYIVFSFEGEGLPVAWRLQQEGCEVLVGVVTDSRLTLSNKEHGDGSEEDDAKERRLRLFDGMLNKLPADEVIEQMTHIQNKDEYFVLFEMNSLFHYAQRVQQMGFQGNFPTLEDYNFEIDRFAAKEFAKKHFPDLNIQETHTFSTIAEAEEFLKNTDIIWVIKGFDSMANVYLPQATTSAAASEELIAALHRYREVYERSGFLLERYIINAIEVTPGRMYYDGVLLGETVNFENKTIGEKGSGAQSGCSGDLVFSVEQASKICQVTFPKIVDEMARAHSGLFIWDASLYIDPQTKEIFFGEFLPNRPGYNVFYNQLTQQSSLNSFFESVIHKQNPFDETVVGVSTRIFNLDTAEDGCPVAEKAVQYSGNDKNFWPMDVYEKNGQLVTCGYDMNLAAITGAGSSIAAAVADMRSALEQFQCDKTHYRSVDDFTSHDYSTAVLKRAKFCIDAGLLAVPQAILEGLV